MLPRTLEMDVALGAGLRLRTLTPSDAHLVVEATRASDGRALWDAHPAGPYQLADAGVALHAWDAHLGRQVSYGMLGGDGRLLAALGLMLDEALGDGLTDADSAVANTSDADPADADPAGERHEGVPDDRSGAVPDGRRGAELAYWVRPENRRQGLALRGLTALTRWAHDEAGLTRLWLEINPLNTPSLRLAERAGYRFEQRVPRHCRDHAAPDPDQDTWHDCLIFGHCAGPGADGAELMDRS